MAIATTAARTETLPTHTDAAADEAYLAQQQSSVILAAPLKLSADTVNNRATFNSANANPRCHMSTPLATDVDRILLGSHANTAAGSHYQRPLEFLSVGHAVNTVNDHGMSTFLGENGRSWTGISNMAIIYLTRHMFTLYPAPWSDVTLFTFTVKERYSLLERLFTCDKCSNIQLQVNTETRKMYIKSAHDDREEYSCFDVSGKLQRGLRSQLKIQTDAAGALTKNVTFYSSATVPASGMRWRSAK